MAEESRPADHQRSVSSGDSRFGFPKSLRILKRPVFQAVYAGGRQIRRRGFTLFILRQEDALGRGLPERHVGGGGTSPTRLGVTATRKSGKSVVRNRLRRRMREAFRLHQHGIQPGWLVVANMARPAADLPWKDFLRNFVSALQEAGIWAAAQAGASGQTPEMAAPASESAPAPASIPVHCDCPADPPPNQPPHPPAARRPGPLARLAIILLRTYKRRISPYLPPMCRYEPTCSVYAMEAFRRKPFWKAALMTLWRLLRCNPFSRGGYDPVE